MPLRPAAGAKELPEPRSPTSGGGVTDDHGIVVGYGWLDSEWGDPQISLLVDRARRGVGSGFTHGTGDLRRHVPSTKPAS